jgi:eukaryotic-like serine/threonine-protein kinase
VPGGGTSRSRELFGATLALPERERAGFLALACGGDTELKAEIESLLSAHASAGSLLESTPARAQTVAPPPEASVDRWIGPYRVLRPLGAGGMGSILLAVREDRGIQRHVAIKRMHPGVDSSELVRRFHAEQRALAALEHPAIARYLDSGIDADGRPYLVMEPVDGMPITALCEREGLSIHERLVLCEQVCAAVQYAHGRLVVHRDLKPDNVLVRRGADGTWCPMIVDFGLAKLLDPAVSSGERTTLAWMTPAYASPEQVRREPIGTATDVYSLGVLLYELLARRRPLDLDGLAPAQIERAICELEPQPPSTAPGLSPRERRSIAGDLDKVVARAMRKEPSLRYPSPADLAADLRAHREGRPVAARAPTVGYRLSKFVRRNRVLVASALAVALVAAAGVAGVMRETLRVAAEARRVERINRFLRDALATVDPADEGRDVRFLEVLDRTRDRIEPEFRDDPVVQAALLDTVGSTFHHLGSHDQALPLLARALELRRAAFAPTAPEVRESLDHLGDLHYDAEQFDEANAIYLELRALLSGLGDEALPELAACLDQLGLIALDQGRDEEAGELFEQSLAIRRARLGEDDLATAQSHNNLALLHHRFDRWKQARAEYERALEIQRAAYGRPHPEIINTLGNLARLLALMGEPEEALSRAEEALSMSREVHGTDAPDTAWTATAVSDRLRACGRLEEAETLARDALRIHLLREDPDRRDSAFVAQAQYDLAKILLARNDPAGAAAELRGALERYVRQYGEDHSFSAITRIRLAEALADAGQWNEASTTATRLIDLVADSPAVAAEAHVVLARCAAAAGDDDRAREEFDRALVVREEHGAQTARTPLDLYAYGSFLLERGEVDAAKGLLERAQEQALHWLGEKDPTTARIREKLALCTQPSRPLDGSAKTDH